MSIQDDRFDMQAAWERYEKAWKAWIDAVDAEPPRPSKRLHKKLVKALRGLHDAAEAELHNDVHDYYRIQEET